MLHSVIFNPVGYTIFKATVAYSAGDCVMYDGTVYKFTTAHAAGAWTGTDATTETGERNTWDDWGLIPINQPVFNPPALKEKTLPIPSRDGELDLTEAIRGYPLYENRVGQLSFLAPQGYQQWLNVYDQITSYLHGQRAKAVLEDDLEHYYEGRFAINKMACDRHHGTIVIDYNLGPYRWSISESTGEDWLWDPFSFVDGVIQRGIFSGIALTATATTLEYALSVAGRAPVKPVFGASGGAVVITYGSNTKTISSGNSEAIDGLILYGGSWLYDGQPVTVTAKADSGTANLSITFRAGRL